MYHRECVSPSETTQPTPQVPVPVVTHPYVIANHRNGAFFPAQVLSRARMQLAAMEQRTNGMWEQTELLFPTKNELTIVKELEGLTPEEAFSPPVINEYLTSSPSASRGDQSEDLNMPQAGGAQIETEHEIIQDVESDGAESVSVCNDGMYLCKKEENEAKGHLDVMKSDIEKGTHDKAMTRELTQWLEQGVLDPKDKPPLEVKPITTRWVHTWKLKDG
eukprot:GHVR01059235.1.p1 GENE.GHVR01059235.1~~GHVR01059235.1.p1  ORF type:complete len:219 (-),score=41.14 GHVR01059235.1:594-1250(-)